MNKILFIKLIFAINLSACSIFVDARPPNLIEEKYTVHIPDTWEVRRDPDDRSCIIVDKPDKKKAQEFTLLICVAEESPKDIAARQGFFYSHEKWFRGGAMDSEIAALVEQSGTLRLYGSASCGISDEAGMHSAGGVCFSAVVFGETYSVTLETDGTEENIEAIQKIAQSVMLASPGSKDAVRSQLQTHNTYD